MTAPQTNGRWATLKRVLHVVAAGAGALALYLGMNGQLQPAVIVGAIAVTATAAGNAI